VDVMALENLPLVVVIQGRCGGSGGVEKQVHSHGEISRVNESGLMLLNQGADSVEFFVPAGSAHDHVLACADAGFNIGEHAVGGGEIDDGGDVRQAFRGQRGTIRIFLRSDDVDVMSALGGDFRHQRSGFASTEQEKIHTVHDLTTGGTETHMAGVRGPTQSGEHFGVDFREEGLVQTLDYFWNLVFFDHERQVNF